MTVSRRRFVAGLGAATGLRFMAPIVIRAGEALGAVTPNPAVAARNRLIVIFQAGGNDGLNTVIPIDDVPGAARYSVYRKVRPSIGYDPSATLPLRLNGDDTSRAMALNAKLKTVHKLYGDGRLAIVQGVDYPQHNYSHFESTDIWQSGLPEGSHDSGWIGRHLDRDGIGEGEIRGLGVGNELPLALQGQERQGVEIQDIQATHFLDGTGDLGDARHRAFALYGNHPRSEPMRHYAGKLAEHTVALVDSLEQIKAPPKLTNPLAFGLLTARTLLEQNFGVECVFVPHRSGSYDTHAAQVGNHENLLTELDQAIEAFLFGTMGGTALPGVGPLAPELAAKTMIVTTSEFGRRIGETGAADTAGTDHGAAGPLLIIGPPRDAPGKARLVPGLHGDHPDMGTPTLPADNLEMTTELRRVYQAVLEHWLQDPDPNYDKKFGSLPGLFA